MESTFLHIHGIATALPEMTLTQEEAAGQFRIGCRDARTERLMRRLLPLTGIRKRHLGALAFQHEDPSKSLYQPAADEPQGPGMGIRERHFFEAAEPLLTRVLDGFSSEQLGRVRALITVSCTHASSPGMEQCLMVRARLPADVDRCHLGFMGCSASLAAMRTAHRMRAARDCVMIAACEMSSLHFQYSDRMDQLTANALFADGAAMMLLDARPSPCRLVDCQCVTLTRAADQMTWTAGDHGFQLTLSDELPKTIASAVPGIVGRFLDANQLRPSDVAHWLVHPGGPQIVDAVEHSLGLRPGALELSRGVLAEYGNMSSPTILFILRDLLARPTSGRCVMLAFGPGLTVEATLLEIKRP